MFHYQDKQLTVFQSSLYQTTTAVVETDEAVIMTDPNWLPGEIENIRAFIDERLGDKKLYIIYTHSDFDHIIGSGAFPEATIIAAEELETNLDKEERMQEIEAFDEEYYILRKYIPQYPKVDISIKENGEQLTFGDVTVTFYKAPGHTGDGLFTVIEPYGIFLSGDYLSDVEIPFITSSYSDYRTTISRAAYILKRHQIRCHVPGHGNVTTDKKEIVDRLCFSHDYLEHLLEDSEEVEKKSRRKFRFFEAMKKSHLENIKIAKKERKDESNLDSDSK